MSTTTKFAYFGTPSVARDTLSLLLAEGFTPAVVITSPDAPKGRGLTLTPTPTKVLAQEQNLPVLTPERLDAAALEQIKEYGCDYAIVVAYGKLFPEELIQAFPKGVFNVHYSLLPKYRGATPLESALLAGDNATGVTVQKMVKEMDAGDIIAQEATAIGADETARELRPRLIVLGAKLLTQALPEFFAGDLQPQVQDATQATRAYKIQKSDGELDLSGDAKENWNKYRAYADTIGTYFFENLPTGQAGGKRMKITSAEFAGGKFRVLRVIPEGKRETDYQSL